LIQISIDHYYIDSYDSKARFCSYWHQINEIIKLRANKILEIGIGNGFVSEYLKKRKLNVITIDIDQHLQPDIVGNIVKLPFKSNYFDSLICYEVLEHLPYVNFHDALLEINRVTNKFVTLSLPDINPTLRCFIKFPKFNEIRICIPIKRFITSIHKNGGDHYWEIGKKGYSLNKIIADIRSAGFKIEKTYRVFENPYHRFFLLNKI
jgi:ubiquinone/menaquinone biosynthesis C-methylase UbiE